MIRRAYVTRMRLWADSDEETEVRWFRCVPEAITLPVPTPFGSSDWLDPRVPYHLGEVLRLRGAPIKDRTQEWAKRKPYYTARGRYDKGQNALHYSGRAVCGELAAFQFGGVHGGAPPIQTDSYGYAPCCQALLPTRPVAWCDGLNWRARTTHGKAVVAAWCEGLAWSAVVAGSRCPAIQTELFEDVLGEDGDALQVECPGGSVATDCCPEVLLPTVLYLTVAGAVEPEMNGTFPMTYNALTHTWATGDVRACGFDPPGTNTGWFLDCYGVYPGVDGWGIGYFGGFLADCTAGYPAVTVSCGPPFSLMAHGPSSHECSCLTNTPDLSLTVSSAPP